MKPLTVPAEFAAEALAIDDARVAAFTALQVANARGLSSRDVAAMVFAMDVIEVRCEQLRRRFFPRRHKLIITGGVAMVVSKTYRSSEIVWRRPRSGANEEPKQ